MKTKNLFKTLAAALLMPAMLLTTSCSNEDTALNNPAENTAEKGYALPVTVNVTRQGDDATTRATFNESTKKLEFSTGDKLFVRGDYDSDKKFAGVLDYVSDGTFSGTVTTETEYTGDISALLSSSRAILLPAGYEAIGFLVREVHDGYGDDFKAQYDKSFATSKAAGVEQLSLETALYSDGYALAPQNAILNFTLTGLEASTSFAIALTKGDDSISGSVTSDGDGTATFAIGLSGDEDLNDYALTLDGDAIMLVSSSKKVEAGKIYNIERIVASTGPKAVDLGLSVKWANMNVGAESESDYGLFFAWGETTGYGSDTSDGHNFDWASYSLCGGSSSTLTKYNVAELYGTVDNKTVLDAEDDAAVAIWGGSWRMPTYTELNELYGTKSNTADYTWEWTSVDGHNGYRITYNSTGANIFLPAAGFRMNTSLNAQGNAGYYWSSSLYTSMSSYGHHLNVASYGVSMSSIARSSGYSIRPVQK